MFKKSYPKKVVDGICFLTEQFFPVLISKYNRGECEESIFADKKSWSKLLPKQETMDFRLRKITATSSDFKNNHDVCLAFIKWPEVKFPTAAKSCMVAINRLTHKAKLYVLEGSFCGSMVIQMAPGSRINTGITIPDDSEENLHFMASVIDLERIKWK